MKKRSKWFSKSFWVSLGTKAAGVYLISQGNVPAGSTLIAASNGAYNVAQGAEDNRNPEHNTEEQHPVNSRKLVDTLITGAIGAYMTQQGMGDPAAVVTGTAAVSYIAGEALANSGRTYRDI